MPGMMGLSGAASALGIGPANTSNFQYLLDQQNNDQLLRQKRKVKTDPYSSMDQNGNPLPGPFSSSQSYRDLLGVG